MKQCVNCGAENKENQNFCSQCGEKLLETPATNATIFCGNCGNSIAKGTPFCPYCGCRLNKHGTPAASISSNASGFPSNPVQPTKINDHASIQPPKYGLYIGILLFWDALCYMLGIYILSEYDFYDDEIIWVVVCAIMAFLLSLYLFIPMRSYYQMAVRQLNGKTVTRKRNGQPRDFVKEYKQSTVMFPIMGLIFGISPFALSLLLVFG